MCSSKKLVRTLLLGAAALSFLGATNYFDTLVVRQVDAVQYVKAFPSTTPTKGIQEAINNCTAGVPCQVSIEGKEYALTASILANRDDLVLEGQGDLTVLKNHISGERNVLEVSGSRVLIRNLEIDGQKATQVAGRGINVTGSDVTIDNV